LLSDTWERKKNTQIILLGKYDGKRPLGKTRLGWQDIIKLLVTDKVRMRGSGVCGPVQEPLVDSYEQGNAHSGSIKDGNFIDHLRN
jgi:hypothetical protein